MEFPVGALKSAHSVWLKHMAKVNSRRYIERETLRIQQQPDSVDSAPIDLSDIDAIFKEKGRGPHLLEIEFEPMTKEPETYKKKGGTMSKRWEWKHKVEGKEILRFPNQSGKSFDTSKLSSYLKTLKESDGRSFIRARHILTLNNQLKFAADHSVLEGPTSHPREKLLLQQVSKLVRPSVAFLILNLTTCVSFPYFHRFDLYCLPLSPTRRFRLFKELLRSDSIHRLTPCMSLLIRWHSCELCDCSIGLLRRNSSGCLPTKKFGCKRSLLVRTRTSIGTRNARKHTVACFQT